ncbi:LOW QUALITY PROTEIN: putative amino acid decarboxylase [Colletotrichum tofieldiae]|nr:LOW QUALITY PROTEIN: putative amino acid decarboxylase [Colletotrichum tofieldiae]
METLSGRTLEKVVNGRADNDALAAAVNSEAADLDAVLVHDVLDQRRLADNLDELLAGVAVLVDLADVTRGDGLVQWNVDGGLDAAEPGGDVRGEGDVGAELGADLALVDVVDVVLGRGLGAGARVPRNTEDGGRTAEVLDQGGNTQLRGSGVATGVGDLVGLVDFGAASQLGKTVRPGVVEAVVGGQVDNDATVVSAGLAGVVDGLNVRLANTVGESHDPAVDGTLLLELSDLIGAQVLVDDFALGVALKLLASELTRRDVAKIHVGVGIEHLNESLAGITTSTNQGDAGGNVVGGVLLAQRRVGVGGGVRGESWRRRGPCRAASHRRETAGLGGGGRLVEVAARSLSGAAQAGLQVGVTKHGAAVGVELVGQDAELLKVVDAVPEELVALAGEAAVGLVKEPGEVLVLLADGPDELGVVLLDGVEDVLGDVAQPSLLGDGQGSQGRDDGEAVKGLVIVGFEGSTLQELDVSVNGGLGVHALAVADEGLLQLGKVGERGDAVGEGNLVSTTDQGTGARIGEQLLLQVTGVNDGHAGGSRQGLQKFLDLLDLEAGAVTAPRLRHEVIVLLVEVDVGDLVAGLAVEETALLGEVDNLQGLERAGKLGGGDIGVDVEDLALGGLGHGGKNGDVALGDGKLDGRLVNAGDLADQVPLLLVEVVGGQDGGQRTRPDAKALELLDELHVLLEEQLAGDGQGLAVSHTDTLLELGLDTRLLKQAVQLRARAMDDDGVQADLVEEGDVLAEVIEVVGENGTADLDNGELLGGDGSEVLLALTAAADLAQGADNDGSGTVAVGLLGLGACARECSDGIEALEGVADGGDVLAAGDAGDGSAGAGPDNGSGEHRDYEQCVSILGPLLSLLAPLFVFFVALVSPRGFQ